MSPHAAADLEPPPLGTDFARLVADRTSNAIIVTDALGRTRWVNAGFTRMTGYTLEEMAGRTPGSVLQGPGTEREAVRQMSQAIRAGVAFREQVLNYAKGGQSYWVDVQVEPLRTVDGRLDGFIAVETDITETRRLEEEGRRLERLLGEVSGLSQVGGWEIDFPAQRLHWTGATRAIHEWDRPGVPTIEEALQFYPTEDLRALVRQVLDRSAGGHEGFDFTLPFRTARGRDRWVHVIGRVEVSGGAVQRIFGSIQDITEQRQREADLQADRARYALVLEAAGYGLFDWEAATGRVRWDPVKLRLYGYPEDASPDRTVGDFISHLLPEDLAETEATLADHAARGASMYCATYRIRRCDGEIRHLTARVRLLYDEQGTLVRGLGLEADVTERVQAQVALEESEARFRAFAEQLPFGLILCCTTDRKCQYVNPAAERILGRTFAELVSPDGSAGWSIHPEDSAEAWPRIRRPLTDEPRVLEYRVLHRCGRVAWVRHRIVAIGDQGKPTGRLACLFEDITREREAEQAREAFERQVRQAQKLEAVGTLAGGIAHDFNNILGAILGFAEVVETAVPDNAEAREAAGFIQQASLRARDLVRKLVAFSRGQEPRFVAVDLAAVAREAVHLLRATLPATVEVDLEVRGSLPPVRGDESQIHQVLINLGTNAGHAVGSRPGRIRIVLDQPAFGPQDYRAWPDLQAGEVVRMVVSDTGHGMDAATLDRIFEPFFTTKGPNQGSGLGLAVVHGIVRGHRAAIRVESEVGRGSTFTILWPVAETVNRPPPDVPAPAAEPAPPITGRVLLVEDDALVASATAALLNSLGWEVEVAARPAAALEQLVTRGGPGPDVVLTDLSMPGMSGLDFALAFRRLRPTVPILLTSGQAEVMMERTSRRGLFAGTVAKPATRASLDQALRSALQNRPAEPPLESAAP